VTAATPGAPVGTANNRAAKFDGRDGTIVTTQSGGVGEAASIMAWVNLASLPSEEHRYFCVAGESQNGNDLDLQIESDNVLKFYTAAGGHLSYTPSITSLVNQWHCIIATLDTTTQTRTIYWDGKPVATDKGGGRAGKTGIFSIGASTVFGGRFFKGEIAEIGLWNRALKATEIDEIYAASKANAAAGGAAAKTNAPMLGTGPFATKAKVTASDSNGPIALKREEQIALMFLTAIQNLESDCQSRAKHSCTLDQLIAGATASNGAHLRRLKFDPRTDPNYTYTVAAGGMAWEAHANPKKTGLAGFYFMSKNFPSADAFYNPSGPAGLVDKELMERGVEGDSFATN
jgi:hypothetical protein